MTHAVESIIAYCVLKVANDQQGQLLVNGFEVIDQGEKVLFEVFGVVVLTRVCGFYCWCVW